MKIIAGQRIRITYLHDGVRPGLTLRKLENGQSTIIGQDPLTMVARAGDRCEGIVTDADTDGFFELRLDHGEAIGFYEPDPTIQIEVLTALSA